MKKISGICFFVVMTCCILTHSSLSLAYAALGLELWYEKMVPVLLPFMILSGTLIRMGLVNSLIRPVYPCLKNISSVQTWNLCDPDGISVRISHGSPYHC